LCVCVLSTNCVQAAAEQPKKEKAKKEKAKKDDDDEPEPLHQVPKSFQKLISWIDMYVNTSMRAS
jgi:hypothetical protein